MVFITAPRSYEPGELVYKDELFAKVLPREKKDKQCEFCHESSENLINCDKCSDVKYCDPECRKQAAADHRMECGKLNKLKVDSLEVMVRLLARIIIKIKGMPWYDIKREIVEKCVTFEDIDSHYEEMTSNPRFVLFFNEIKGGLKDLIEETNLPTDENLRKIIGKVRFSSFEITSGFCTEFCFGLDRFQHECIPNCNFESCGRFVKVWAIKSIKEAEKITISRRRLFAASFSRSPFSNDSLGICKCTECSLPYGESVLTKILDKNRAYDTIFISEKVITMALTMSKLGLEEAKCLGLLVDAALEKHLGILAPTNALHLKLLYLKTSMVEGTPFEKMAYFLHLEKNLRLVFGDKYLELREIYHKLSVTYFEMGHILGSIESLAKAHAVGGCECGDESGDDE